MKKILITLIFAAVFVSCNEDYLDASLQSTVTDDDIAQLADESPEALLNVATSFDVGTINTMRSFDPASNDTGHFNFGQKAVDLAMDLMSNDMINDGNGWWFDDYYRFTGRTQDRRESAIIWNYYYEIIKGANQTISLIGNLDESQLTDDLSYVLARSKVVRGLAYLSLIQIYQKGNPALTDAGVPLVDPTADLINGPGFGRNTVADVYAQIELDLMEGYTNLEGFGRADKTAINKNIAAAYLSRYYLLRQDYAKAVTYAQEAQAEGSLSGDSLSDGFQFITNPEWIWGADLNADTTSYYASFFAQMQTYSPTFHAGNGYTPGYTGQLGHHKTIDKRLYEAISDTDIRKSWFGPDNGNIHSGNDTQIYNFKFYDDTFFEADYVYMRVAEFYLIEAEAKAAMGDDSGAADALYTLVSTRDEAYTRSTNTGADLMDEIRTHRRIELWGEGFGLLDMKRWGVGLNRVFDGSTHPDTPASYFDLAVGSPLFTFQIPEAEINTNDAISAGDQNP